MDNHDNSTKRVRQHVGPVTAAISAMRNLMPWESDGSPAGERRAAIWEARRYIMEMQDRSRIVLLSRAARLGPRELASAIADVDRRRGLRSSPMTGLDCMGLIFGEGVRESDPYPMAYASVFLEVEAALSFEH